MLLQLVGALQVGQQPLGGLRVAPHRDGRCRSAAAGPDAEAPIAGDGGRGGGAGRRELGIGRRRIGFGLIWVRSRCRTAAAASSGRKRRGAEKFPFVVVGGQFSSEVTRGCCAFATALGRPIPR